VQPQKRNDEHEPAESHPRSAASIQGWTPDFIPWVLQEAVDKKFIDELIRSRACRDRCVAQARTARGIFTGISGGATFGVAMQVAEKAPAGSVLLAMLPDTGERYLSTRCSTGRRGHDGRRKRS